MSRMVRFGRLLVVALLVAMIPAKGFAAARMLYCGVTHDRTALMVQSQHQAEPGNQAMSALPPCHAAEAESDGAPPSGNNDGSCSICAVCAATTAIAGEPAAGALPPPAVTSIPPVPAHFAGHIPPTLDRPPLA